MGESTSNPGELAKSYDPAVEEPKVRAAWDAAQPSHAEPAADADGPPPYCILIPPPNVTAALHLGHALNNTLQDVLIRYHRAQGRPTLWMPGTDHAGIATQAVIEKRLWEDQGKRRKDLDPDLDKAREKFVAITQAWKDEYEATIIQQLKMMGCSCDWERTRFTMDEMCARAVREAFFRLFKDGLIYRGKRLVNWDPVLQTAVADDECYDEEIEGQFYYLRYPLIPIDEPRRSASGHLQTYEAMTGESFITVATTRPETMLGDTGVAVNPRDPRAAALKGRFVRLPLVGREIPIVIDDYVVLPVSMGGDEKDPKAQFATGFLKVTPAHDPNDWEIGQRHNLEAVNIFAPDASVSDKHGWNDVGDAGFLVGLDRFEARKAIVGRFEETGVLAERKPYRHSVSHSDRSKAIIEPYLSDQWYVKVTDDRMRGDALRAMTKSQRSSEASPKRERGFEEHTSTTSPKPERGFPTDLAYLITWTCKGTWLHGDERGSVDDAHNTPGAPLVPADENRQAKAAERLTDHAFHMNDDARQIMCRTIEEVCEHRGWMLLAVNVRSNHIHTVVIADDKPEQVMSSFKAYGTRRLCEADIIARGTKPWTEHGSTRYVKGEPSILAACQYVLHEQGDNLAGAVGGRLLGRSPSDVLAHASGSLRTPSWQGQLHFHPDRYAKTFENWHENIRDWCISRQLWWGHRIPVWGGCGLSAVAREYAPGEDRTAEFALIERWEREGRIAVHRADVTEIYGDGEAELNDRSLHYFVCVRNAEADEEVVAQLERWGLKRDPDVLDTWFSSALWPLSTMGWPDPESYEETRSNDGQPNLLDYFNPTSVLCTAREIITLWVSRMVMFNLYFTQDTDKGQRLPFRDVFIHAMIQDGQGRKMSKSLGNGVDPRDIIRSKGADAMRFTLVQMTTQTQDVRMPVEYDETIGANTSPKFELGRRLSNKIWNATRFAIGILSSPADASTSSAEPTRLVDRWMLSRLARTLGEVEKSIHDYDFSVYAQQMYDLFWRDLCDWYLEAIKPTVREDAIQQCVLRSALGAVHRMFHPIMPFVTESLHASIESLPVEPLNDVELRPSDLAATAPWPCVPLLYVDDSVEARFARVQELVTIIREVRSVQKVHDRRQITLHVSDDATMDLIAQAEGVVEALAGLGRVSRDAAGAGGGVTFLFGNVEHHLTDLTDAIDISAERDRLTRQKADLEKKINGLQGRLANKGYIEKAPPKLVEETKQQLSEAQAELDSIIQSLERLGS